MVEAAAIAASSYTYHLSPITCRPPSGNDYDEIRLTAAYFELEGVNWGGPCRHFTGCKNGAPRCQGLDSYSRCATVLGPAVSKMLT
jgi:hypothetical protein